MPAERQGNEREEIGFTNPLTGEQSSSPAEARETAQTAIEDFSADFVRPPVGDMTDLERRAYRMAALASALDEAGPRERAANLGGWASKEFLSRSRPVEGTEHLKLTDNFRPGVILKGWNENLAVTGRRIRETGVRPQLEEQSEETLALWQDGLLAPLQRTLSIFEQEMLAMALEAEAERKIHGASGDEYRAAADRTLSQNLVDELARNVGMGQAETVKANRALWHRAFDRLVAGPEEDSPSIAD